MIMFWGISDTSYVLHKIQIWDLQWWLCVKNNTHNEDGGQDDDYLKIQLS